MEPCPFCGSNEISMIREYCSNRIFVYCRNCKARGPEVWKISTFHKLNPYDHTESAWNQRAKITRKKK